MKITIERDAKAGDQSVPKGEYSIGVEASGRELNLVKGGRDLKVPCVSRKAKKPIRFSDAMTYGGGGDIFHISVKMAPNREYVATLTYDEAEK